MAFTLKTANGVQRILNARPDTVDFRDRMYEPTLVEVPQRIPLSDYKRARVPVLDQGGEGACTGFGLATVAHYLLRRRRVMPDQTRVSPRMFYEMAKRYDDWPGVQYEGSSARGAMKGWHKHGVCSEAVWPYRARETDRNLTDGRAHDATGRPLGAYYRVNHNDLVAMHSALAEVGILYATATVHEGWRHVGKDGVILFTPDALGGHAFAVVAYDERGFWIQNSWGKGWGQGGFGLVSYDDWLANGTDVWVARLGAPVVLHTAEAAAASRSAAAGQVENFAYRDVRPHIISIGNDGLLDPGGTYGTSAADVKEILTGDFPRITATWQKKRLLLYAHGGLVDEASAIQHVADYRAALLEANVYPLAFIWHSDYWTTLKDMLEDAVKQRRPEGILDNTKDFMLDRLDDLLEPLARTLTGKAEWDEMKENAQRATGKADGGARIVLGHLDTLLKADPGIEIHVVGHSAGGIFHGPLIQLLTTEGRINAGPMKGQTGYGRRIASCTLWAPACTVALFKEAYLPALEPPTGPRRLGRLSLFTLTDAAEQDDHCAHIYHKSLLYLVSHAFEEHFRIPLVHPDGEPILGMQKFVLEDPDLRRLIKARLIEWITAPNDKPDGSADASTARHHGDFDDDKPTLQATLARILGAPSVTADFTFNRSASSLRERRLQLV